ncbi:uncharacterized protein PFL1_05435 [Pseudozyma flocculosa PF-1]|uniref:Related to GS1 protein n=2 Tax=Pseudozyma flocculosa TaxID=84751 RepID=A0A5C3FC80_9BASI|nr:uncharacterized protein PFL1_05435 [Pseudozyma flocculosa PF-1]EPQ27154.1 hypothetical protein PFL1_05435 [Pseudozyma flocculosa PF-1]SPO41265.1 related to GS1 protein [Pseudozyma flocculosa]
MAPLIAPIRAVLFDMDGLLIDSEGIYTRVVNEMLAPYGKQQTWAIKANLMGKPERAATLTLLSSLWPSPNSTPQNEEVADDCPFSIDTFLADRNHVLEAAFRSVPAMPGAQRLVTHLAKHNVPICVATGSKRKNYDIKTNNLPAIFAPFGKRIVCGDDPRLKRGKPFPDIFLLAAREGLLEEQQTSDRLGKDWTDGIRMYGEEHDAGGLAGGEAQVLVFEDAKPGVAAAKAAGMHVVWVPDPNLRALYPAEELGASQTIDSLLDFDPTAWGLPPFDDDDDDDDRA